MRQQHAIVFIFYLRACLAVIKAATKLGKYVNKMLKQKTNMVLSSMIA